jgi:GNAT superfamily N-acetyltransferase
MISELVIKKFSDKDINQLQELIHDTIKCCYPSVYSQEVVDFFIDYHSSDGLLKKSLAGIILIGFIGNRIVATGYLFEHEVGGIYVHPDYQKRGFGKQLLMHLLDEARKKELSYVWLDSTPLAKSMYLKAGFKVVEEKVMTVENNMPLDYFYMELAFDS